MGDSLHFKTSVRQRKPDYLFYPYTDLKIWNTQKSQKSLRYSLRANPLNSSISPLFTPSKITILTPKIPSNHWKSSTFSNSTENIIFNKEIIHKNISINNSEISQNTSKINTFTLQHKSKFHTSIEVQNLSHHKSHNEHNQKITITSITKRE